MRGFRIFAFGWRVAIFFAVVGISELSTLPEGGSWAQFAMRSFFVGFGSFRAWKADMGGETAEEAPLLGIDIFTFDMVRDGLAMLGGFFVCFRESL